MPVVPWSQNDVLFRQLVSEGHAWQALPYIFLTLKGFEVEMPDLSVRDDVKDAGNWIDSIDLRIGDRILEVKSRNLLFTNSGDYPYETALLDTKSGWDAKEHKPYAYIFVSRGTGGMVATPGGGGKPASHRWEVVKKFDHTRKIRDEFYLVRREHLCTMENLVRELRK